MLRAGALLYAVAFSLLFALLSGSLILFAYVNTRVLNSDLLWNRVVRNSSSGINLLLSRNTVIKSGEQKTIDLFNDQSDSVKLQRMTWGIYEVLVSTAFMREKQNTLVALKGSKPVSKDEFALYLCDQNKPLSLAGNTVIKGKCLLPKEGVKRAYIEGQSFSGNQLINGTILKSGSRLPPLDTIFIAWIRNLFLKPDNERTTIKFPDGIKDNSLSNSFLQPTLLLYSADPIYLQGVTLNGNIICFSEKSVTIGSESKTSDIIIASPYIRIENNFHGSLQAFSTDSMSIGEEVHLDYPSALCILNSKNNDKLTNTLMIAQNTTISGDLLAINLLNTANPHNLISITKNVLLTGEVYCNGTLDLKGSVKGSVSCDKFILSTPSSVYENHLLNAEIKSPDSLSHFLGSSFITNNTAGGISKWLH